MRIIQPDRSIAIATDSDINVAEREHKLASLIYNILLKYYYLQNRHGYLGRTWRRAWKRSCKRFSCPVYTTIHGRRAIVNFGHTYALYARRFPHWNNPLIELVHQVCLSKQRKINVIDVGAGVGDTVLMLAANCPDSVERYYCIEGEEEFYGWLIENVRALGNAVPIHALLSDKFEDIPSLKRSNAGTASAVGDSTRRAVTLDSLFDDATTKGPIDVIKVDVDGYDGRVLRGASSIIGQHRPAVIFEWDPHWCNVTGNDWLDHFTYLNGLSYRRFVWFSKYGDFSHFMTGVDTQAIKHVAEVCLSNGHGLNWHYDIVALHEDAPDIELGLSTLTYAKQRRSVY